MKSLLPGALSDRVTVGGKTYRIRPTALRVLTALDALKAEDLLPADRLRLAKRLLYRIPRPRDDRAAVEAALEALEEPAAYNSDGKKPQALDLKQDAAMITAAFMQLYGLRLPDALATLDWRVFLALLNGITDAATMGQIIHVRTMDVPRWTATNGEYRRNVQKQKLIYAIKTPARRTDFETGLRGMVEILMAMAGGDDDESGNQSGQD